LARTSAPYRSCSILRQDSDDDVALERTATRPDQWRSARECERTWRNMPSENQLASRRERCSFVIVHKPTDARLSRHALDEAEAAQALLTMALRHVRNAESAATGDDAVAQVRTACNLLDLARRRIADAAANINAATEAEGPGPRA